MPQLSVALSATDNDHWNIVNDSIFPNCLGKFRARHEASQTSGAARLTRRPSSHGESSTPTHEFPFPTWPQPPSTPILGWGEVDERVAEVMDQLHDLHLETVQEMGFIRSVDQALAKSLMVEFLRLKLITEDNLSTTLRTWYTDMEATTEEFLRNLDSATKTYTALPSKNAMVQVALHKYLEVAKLKLALLLTHLDLAQEEMEKFIQFHLKELQSQQETKNLTGDLSSRITDHRSRVRQVLCSEPLRHPEVVPLVLVGMAANQPLESNFFPGLLEGLLGRLGIAAPGESKPPTSSREGAGHLWASTVHEAILQIEKRDVKAPGSTRLPQCLDLHYKEDFLEKQGHQIPALFSDPLFILSMANVVYKAFKPPVVPVTYPSTSSLEVPSVPSHPEDGGPGLEVPEPMESAPSTSNTNQRVEERVTEAPNTDSDKIDEPTLEKESPPRGLKVKIPGRSGNEGVRPLQAAPKMVPLPLRYKRSQKPMTLRPQPLPDFLRLLSEQLGLSCMTRTFLRSRKSVPESSVLTKERRPPKRILTPHLLSD